MVHFLSATLFALLFPLVTTHAAPHRCDLSGASSLAQESVTIALFKETDDALGAAAVATTNGYEPPPSATNNSAYNSDSSPAIALTQTESESTPISSSTSSAIFAPAVSSNSTSSSSDYSCGYILSSHSNAYFPRSYAVSFSSLSSLADSEFVITDGWQVGGVGPDGTRSVGSTENVKIIDGDMVLTVPGGQSVGGEVTAAEVTFREVVGGGVFTMEAQLDGGAGTCQSIFTYTQSTDVGNDEQDIEMLGQSLLSSASNGAEPGIQLTNWDPTNAGENEEKSTAFPDDPTTAYHNYTIGWLPGGTKYYYDGQELEGPSKYASVNPSNLIINNWSNGDASFTAGPPSADVSLRVKSVTFYYQSETLDSYPANPSGCSEVDACVV
ncbi:hypothetical protein I350_06471 [Cryptococcus amylolentus CBS 6273]|uniref:GH16 domain-containing protein n=1 Tax=Cryptococcus amylolentus CBS 6273 TaxID=1296118 RepID=A0A1E3JNE5_9TREE|nr:hypothetical protein I350_06471 [Cryptococcus amylolentus CBS 6273]